MEANAQGNPIVTLVMFAIISIPVAITSYKLAKEKGRNVTLWTVLGCIPFINFLCISYFIGAANLKLEAKIDELLSRAK